MSKLFSLLLLSAWSTSCLAQGCAEMPDLMTSDTLRVVTLNVAHGRGLGMNQMLQGADETRDNLTGVAGLLRGVDADLVALQEADGPSRWSGNFDHVDQLAKEAGYPCRGHGLHAVTFMYAFGTAVMARYRFTDSLTHDFIPSPPTTTKGFTMGVFDWNPGGELPKPVKLHVISVHLDFSRKSVRESQIAEMSEHLGHVEPPIIILGDFNVDWGTDGSVLKKIATEAGLHTWQPEADGLATYKDGKKRLDWILATPDLEFLSYRTAEQEVSDHRAVIAELTLVPRPGPAAEFAE